MVSPQPAASPRSAKGSGLLRWGYLLGFSLAAFSGSAARADTVNLCTAGPMYGRIVHASLGAQSWDVMAGRVMHSASGGSGILANAPSTIVTFCTELLQTQASAPSPYTLSSVATLSGNTGLTNLGFGKQHAIYDIFQAAAGREYTAGLDYATAFQVAVWEIVYDYNANLPNHGLSVDSGNFRATAPGQSALSASITSKVQFLLASVGMNAAANGVMGLRSPQFQDQIFATQAPVVPIPTAAWTGAVGLVLAAGVKWRKRHA